MLGGMGKQLSAYHSRQLTYTDIPKLDSHEEHPASSHPRTLRTKSMDSLWSHVYCNVDHHHPRTCDATDLVLKEFFPVNSLQNWLSYNLPGRLDRQWHMILLEKSLHVRTRGEIIVHITHLMASECSHVLHSQDSWQRAAWGDGSVLSSSFLLEKVVTELLV